MSDFSVIPLDILNDSRLTRADLRVYGLLSARTGNDEIDFVVIGRNERRRISKLVKLGYVGIEKDSNGLRYKLVERTDMKQQAEITLSAFTKEYETYARSVHTPKTVETYQTAFRELIRVEGDRSLKFIGIREIEHFLATKKVEASDHTARKYHISLASAFEKGIQWRYITENPFREVAKPKVREVIPVYFTGSDFRLFLSACPERDFRELCITGFLTGLRLGELIHLHWTDMDFQMKKILVQNHDDFTTKSKRSRVVPMTDEVLKLLTERKKNIRSESELVFPNKHGRKLNVGLVEHKFKITVRRAGLNDKLHFHSLRHSFASALVLSGVSLYAVSKLLGHSQTKTTEIYSHLLPDQLHGEVNKLDKRFDFSIRGNER
jgi:site-specific recombinase XerD